MSISFADIKEGAHYTLDWRIGGVKKEYRVLVENKNEDTNTVYLQLFMHPRDLVRMVCYRALIDAPAEAADHTWFSPLALKLDRGPVGDDR